MTASFVVALLLGLRHGVSTENVTVLNSFIQSGQSRIKISLRYALNLGIGHALGMALIGMAIIKITPYELPSWNLWIERVSVMWIASISIFMFLDAWGYKIIDLAKLKNSLRHSSSSWIIGAILGLSIGAGDVLFFALLAANALNPSQDISLFLIFFSAMFFALGGLAIGFSLLHGSWTKDPHIATLIKLWVNRIVALASMGVSIALLVEAI